MVTNEFLKHVLKKDYNDLFVGLVAKLYVCYQKEMAIKTYVKYRAAELIMQKKERKARNQSAYTQFVLKLLKKSERNGLGRTEG